MLILKQLVTRRLVDEGANKVSGRVITKMPVLGERGAAESMVDVSWDIANAWGWGLEEHPAAPQLEVGQVVFSQV